MTPELTEKLKRALLPLLVYYPNGAIDMLGAAWVVATTSADEVAMLVTASHILTYIDRVTTEPMSHPSVPDVLNLKLRRSKSKGASVHALFQKDDETVHTIDLIHAWHNGLYDIAICSAMFNDQTSPRMTFPLKFAIDSAPQKVGTEVLAIGYSEISCDARIGAPNGPNAGGLRCSLTVRRGRIIDTYDPQNPKYKWPGFYTDIPFESGMSGSPILSLNYQNELVACGIVTKDMSEDADNMTAGSALTSFATALYPMMAMTVHAKSFGIKDERQLIRLVEFEQYGRIQDRARASENIEILEGPKENEVRISWKSN